MPGLPLRERRGEFIWFARFPDVAAAERSAAALEHDLLWADFQETLSAFLAAPVQVWRLAPIGRSAAFR